jgi:hypothetical protein
MIMQPFLLRCGKVATVSVRPSAIAVEAAGAVLFAGA